MKTEKLTVFLIMLLAAIQIKAQHTEESSPPAIEEETKAMPEPVIETLAITKLYENDHFQLEYPEDWELFEKGMMTEISIPDQSFDNASFQVLVTKSNMISPPIIESMIGDLEILHYPGMDQFITQMAYSKITIDGQIGALVKKNDENRTYHEYTFVFEAPLKVVEIKVKTGKNTYPKFESAINQILASIKFKETSSASKLVVVEVTEEEFTKDWVVQKAQMQGALSTYEVTKLDSFLFNLQHPTYRFKITDADIEINNWADFFVWKPQTALKEYEIFAYQTWPGKCLELFRMYIHLGDYDKLHIQEMPEKQLELLFSKESGQTIRWVLEYAETHQLPLNEDIPLKRFIYTNTRAYTSQKSGKTAYDVPFLINDEVYKIKVENLSVW